MVESLEGIIAAHPFFSDLAERHIQSLTACAANVRFAAGTHIFREGEPANFFYLIREGRVAIEVSAPPRKPIIVQTLSDGDVLGWPWLVWPCQWRFDARAGEPVQAIAYDGKCLRARCEEDHDLGYELLKRFVQVIAQRLEATRFQMLDVYAAH